MAEANERQSGGNSNTMRVGRRQYNEADMMQMQREAEARVREMQNRARRTAEEANTDFQQPRNRNWSSNPGMNRQRPRRPNQPNQNQHQQNHNQGNRQAAQHPPEPPAPGNGPGHEHAQPHDPAAHLGAPPPKKEGTIIGDIMGALGLDEDYLLIIGLILILINQRADTTLILALAYLLI